MSSITFVTDVGAVGDGIADDHAAITAAISRADAAGGGIVLFPPGTYRISRPIGSPDRPLGGVEVRGVGDRSARIVAGNAFPVVAGRWFQCCIDNLTLDAGGHGGPAMDLHLDKSYVRHNLILGWTGHAIRLNADGELGLLNWVADNHIVQSEGIGIWTSYRFADSWIVDNNVGSSLANLSVEGGPLRIANNHLDGAPRHNIELRGNRRLTIVGNICEGARREAIVYTMPDWLDADDAQIQIVGNAISNGGKEFAGRYPAIGVYGRGAGARTSGFSITGNIFACEDEGAGWAHCVDADWADALSIVGNQWESGGFTVAPVRAGGANVAVVGNTSGDRIPDDVPRVLRFDAASGWPPRPADRRPTFFVGGERPDTLDSDAGDVWLPRA